MKFPSMNSFYHNVVTMSNYSDFKLYFVRLTYVDIYATLILEHLISWVKPNFHMERRR